MREKRSETNRKQQSWHKKSGGNGKYVLSCLLISPFFFFLIKWLNCQSLSAKQKLSDTSKKTPRIFFLDSGGKSFLFQVHIVAKVPHDVRSLLQNGTTLHPGLAVASPEARQNSFCPSNCTEVL